MNQPVTSHLLSPESDKLRFEIQDLLGRGGMGEVYKAWDNELEQDVAFGQLIDVHGFQSVSSNRPVVAGFPAESADMRMAPDKCGVEHTRGKDVVDELRQQCKLPRDIRP